MSIVTVVGSLNCDLVMRVPRHPLVGETVMAESFASFVGGKGNNQAIACARAGGAVAMVGRVGADAFASLVLERLSAAGVDHRFVTRDAEAGTGVATITVDAAGANAICVAAQANARLSPADVDAAAEVVDVASVLLLGLEVPAATALAAARRARRRRTGSPPRVLLNPAPAPRGGLQPDLLAHVDVVILNEPELALLTGVSPDRPEDLQHAASLLRALGARSVVVTLGARGAGVLDESGWTPVAPFPVDVVDSTGAGDAFCGALAAKLLRGAPLGEAVRWGAAAGALACTVPGAEPSLPLESAIARLVGGGGLG